MVLNPNDDPFSKLLETPPFFESWYTWIGILVIAILAGIRSWLRGPQYFSQTSLKGKVALVTGGNRGIGYYTAKELAVRGAKVYIGCRDSALGRSAEANIRELTGNKDVHYVSLKLGYIDEIRKFADSFLKKEEKLDILYCNAGVMTCPPTQTVDGFEYHLGVNYIGHYVLVNALLPLLRAAAPSRIVIISSAAYALGSIHYDDINLAKAEYGNGAECFSQSKLALMLMMNRLSRDLKDSEVTVNACHPGVVRTDIHRHMPIKTSTFLSVSTYPVVWYLMKGPADGAQTPIYLCVDEAVNGVTGKYYVDMQAQDLEGLAADDKEADKLWDFTQLLIKQADQRRAAKAEGKKTDQSEERDDEEDQSEPEEIGQGEGDKKND